LRARRVEISSRRPHSQNLDWQSGFDYSATWELQKQTVNWLDGEVSQPSFIEGMWNAFHS
jgi:hypothetical protein